MISKLWNAVCDYKDIYQVQTCCICKCWLHSNYSPTNLFSKKNLGPFRMRKESTFIPVLISIGIILFHFSVFNISNHSSKFKYNFVVVFPNWLLVHVLKWFLKGRYFTCFNVRHFNDFQYKWESMVYSYPVRTAICHCISEPY